MCREINVENSLVHLVRNEQWSSISVPSRFQDHQKHRVVRRDVSDPFVYSDLISELPCEPSPADFSCEGVFLKFLRGNFCLGGEGQFITSKGASKRKTRHKPNQPKPKGPHQLWSHRRKPDHYKDPRQEGGPPPGFRV